MSFYVWAFKVTIGDSLILAPLIGRRSSSRPSDEFKLQTRRHRPRRRRDMTSRDRTARAFVRGHHLLHASNPSLALVQRTPDAARVAETTASLRERANDAAHQLKKLEAKYSEALEQLKDHGGVLLERKSHAHLESIRVMYDSFG